MCDPLHIESVFRTAIEEAEKAVKIRETDTSGEEGDEG